jgi:thiamine biosynthesis protein ThiC
MSIARRGIATEEMIQVAKEEDIDLSWPVHAVPNGSIIIPKNNVRKCTRLRWLSTNVSFTLPPITSFA